MTSDVIREWMKTNVQKRTCRHFFQRDPVIRDQFRCIYCGKTIYGVY